MRVPPDFIYELSPPVLFLVVLAGVGAVALLIQAILHSPRVAKAAPELVLMTTAVSTIVGAIFGLSMTFLANSVWNTEDKAREAVSAEARAIRVMEVYLDATQEPPHTDLYLMLANYGQGVAEEWHSMADGGPGIVAETSLRNIYASVIRDVSRSDQDRILQQRLLVELDALSTAR